MKAINYKDLSWRQRHRVHKTSKGKEIPVNIDGETKVMQVKKGISGYLGFVLGISNAKDIDNELNTDEEGTPGGEEGGSGEVDQDEDLDDTGEEGGETDPDDTGNDGGEVDPDGDSDDTSEEGGETDPEGGEGSETGDGDKGETQKQSDRPEPFDISPDDDDEYIPHDIEFGEASGEQPHIFEIRPPYVGYYNSGKKSYFDTSRGVWSKKKKLKDLNIGANTSKGKKHTFTGIAKTGLISIPLPEGCLPDIDSLQLEGGGSIKFFVDQNNCIYMKSSNQQVISFDFYTDQIENNIPPIREDKKDIISGKLTDETEKFVKGMKSIKESNINKAKAVQAYIQKTKKYNEKVQGELYNKSSGNNLFYNLDNSPSLECTWSNTLFVGLCRRLGITSRLIMGHRVDGVGKNSAANISKMTGHAWSEIWDEDMKKWIRFDATPIGLDEESGLNDNKGGEGDQPVGPPPAEEDQNGNPENQESESDGDISDDTESQKEGDLTDPIEALDQLMDKLKKEDLEKQRNQLNDELNGVEANSDKHELNKLINDSDLSGKAKEILEEAIKDKILDIEKDELKDIDDEEELKKKLEETLLSDEYKEKLEKYGKMLKEKIKKRKEKMKSEMEQMGFDETEKKLYDEYKQIEKEVQSEVRHQIKELTEILPKKYHESMDKSKYYRSGIQLEGKKLPEFVATGDTKIFRRQKFESESPEINMFEMILIDRSGSMGNFQNHSSPFRNAIKAAITRAKVLEHFKVDFSIVIYDDALDEVMIFGDKFSNRKTKIPSKLMRACYASSGGNSQEPITYMYNTMKKHMKMLGGQSYGSISVIGDGDLMNSQQDVGLKNMIDNLRNLGMGLTNYFIDRNNKKLPLVEYYFGTEEDGGAVYAMDIPDLSKKIIQTHKGKLRNIIRKYLRFK